MLHSRLLLLNSEVISSATTVQSASSTCYCMRKVALVTELALPSAAHLLELTLHACVLNLIEYSINFLTQHAPASLTEKPSVSCPTRVFSAELELWVAHFGKVG